MPLTVRRAAPARLPLAYTVWLAGSLVSLLGDSVLYFALGWAASAHGGSAAGLVLTAIVLPRTVLLLVGGVVGDRAGARRVLIVGDAAMLGVAVVLALVAHRWGTPLGVLVAAGLAVGTVDAFYLPSLGSMPRRLVADDQLGRAVAVRQSAAQVVTMAGAPLGGVLVAAAGLAGAAWLDAATFAVALLVLVAIRPRREAPAVRREPVWREVADGLRVVRRTPDLLAALLLVAGAARFLLPCASLLVPLLARDRLWSPGVAGLVVGALGLGVIGASLTVARLGAARRPGLAAGVGLAIAAAGQLVLALTHPPALAVVAAVVVGAGNGVFAAHLAPVLLGSAPRTHLARVQSLLGLVQSAALLATFSGLGALAHRTSPVTAVLLCSAALATCAAVALATPALRRLPGVAAESA